MTELATTDLSKTPFTWNTLKAIANTEMVPQGLRGKPEAILAAVYMGRELGLGPMQSMNMIDVIQGRPSLSAELQNARIREAGHSIQTVEWTDQVATLKGVRADNGDELTVSFTAEMAKRAGLTGKGNWKAYPEAMLFARAISMLARALFPDVFAAAHVYTPDELGDDTYVPDVTVLPVEDSTGTVEAVFEDVSLIAEARGAIEALVGTQHAGRVLDLSLVEAGVTKIRDEETYQAVLDAASVVIAREEVTT